MKSKILSLLVASIFFYCAHKKMEDRPSSIPAPKAEESLGDSSAADKKDNYEDVSSRSNAKKKTKGRDDQQELTAADTLSTKDVFQTKAPEMLSRYKSDKLEPLPLKAQDISVVVVGHRVRVVFDLVFENPSARQVSGSFIIALPDGGAPVYLGMFQGKGIEKKKVHEQTLWLSQKAAAFSTITANDMKLSATWQTQTGVIDWGELRSAKIINPVKGRQIYEKVTRQRVDPALAEWSGASKFTTRIFPIPANGYKRVVFAFEAPLKVGKSGYKYLLPVPMKSKEQKRLTLHIVSGYNKNVLVTAGGIVVGKFKKTDYGSMLSIRGSSLKADAALVFKAKPIENKLQVLTTADKTMQANLSHIRFIPIAKTKKNTLSKKSAKTGKAVFVLDVSYSAKDKLHNLAGKMIRKILNNDTTLTKFAVITFDVTAQKLSPFKKNTKKNRQSLFRKIESIHLEGATNFQSALTLIAQDKQLRNADSYFLLSDGQITWAEEKPLYLKKSFKNIFNKRWMSYRFGDNAVNQSLFLALTKKKGRIIHVNTGDDLNVAALAHTQTALFLNDISIEPKVDFLVAGKPSLIYPGQVLEFAIKSATEIRELTLSVTINKKIKKIKVPLILENKAITIVARAWASLYANRLLDFYDKQADNLALALSQKFFLTNRAASFIILETDKEYKVNKIEPMKYNLAAIQSQIRSKEKVVGYGIEGYDKLTPPVLSLLRKIHRLQQVSIYNIHKATKVNCNISNKLMRDDNNPVTIYRQALALYNEKPGQALRSLSTIVELKPQDDKALRLTGFTLMQWGFYRPAVELFARSRRRRPFEPQNIMLEALGYTALNKAYQAALRYEILLATQYNRFDEYAKKTVTKLYYDLLIAIQATSSKELQLLITERIKKLMPKKSKDVKGRLILFWNLDNTDVDLHIDEGKEQVSYNHKTSASGGRLFWDNTEGLGPELYEHPTLSKKGFKVSVNYFGSNDVEGQAPSTTMVATFLYGKNNIAANFYTKVLISKQSGKIQIMPLFSTP